MCGRIAIVTWDELLAVAKAMQVYAPINDMPEWPARGHQYTDAFPRSVVPVLCSSLSHEGVNGTLAELFANPAELIWGYALGGKPDVIFNTRIETAATSPLWKDSFENRHCVIPVHAFYEPHKTERVLSPRGREVKQVYRFEEPDAPLMLLGGIWDKDRFSILTTEPDAQVAPVHPRMPVIFDQQAATQWLTFQGLPAKEDIPLTSSPIHPDNPSAPTSGQQLTLF